MTIQRRRAAMIDPGTAQRSPKCGAQPRKAASEPPRGSRQPTFRPFRACLACWNEARSPSEAGIRGISATMTLFSNLEETDLETRPGSHMTRPREAFDGSRRGKQFDQF